MLLNKDSWVLSENYKLECHPEQENVAIAITEHFDCHFSDDSISEG